MSPRNVVDRNTQRRSQSLAILRAGSVVTFYNRLGKLDFQTGCGGELGNAHPFFFQIMFQWFHDERHIITDRITREFPGFICMNSETDPVRPLIETIARELERPREISNQVVKHLDGAYAVDRDSIGTFLKDELPKLEDYEHDLILSPLFTPKLADQAVFAELLGSSSVQKKDWPSLVQQLTIRPTRAHLITSDMQTHSVDLREVSIERYVHRLRLDGSVSETLLQWIDRTPAAERPMLKAVARRAIWENSARRNVLERFLAKSTANASYRLSDVVDLLKLMEDYLPADSPALLARIPRWHKMLEEEINTSYGPKPFFSQTVQSMHGGNDQRKADEERAAAKRSELEFLERIQKVLTEST
jgi:hypothetical protein